MRMKQAGIKPQNRSGNGGVKFKVMSTVGSSPFVAPCLGRGQEGPVEVSYGMISRWYAGYEGKPYKISWTKSGGYARTTQRSDLSLNATDNEINIFKMGIQTEARSSPEVAKFVNDNPEIGITL